MDGNLFKDSWKLIPSKNGSVNSLADLKDGVYAFELASARSGCESSSPGES